MLHIQYEFVNNWSEGSFFPVWDNFRHFSHRKPIYKLKNGLKQLCTGQFQNRSSSPPPLAQILGHLTFLKKFVHIPRYVASLDGQMPHPV